MIKIVFCLRRLPTLTPEAFQHYWREQHAPLVRLHAEALRIQRYVQSHAFVDTRLTPAIAARGNVVEPYDGIAELWWTDIEQLLAASATREGRAAGRALRTDEGRFIDLANSPLFYAQEYEIIVADGSA